MTNLIMTANARRAAKETRLTAEEARVLALASHLASRFLVPDERETLRVACNKLRVIQQGGGQ